MCIFRQYFTWLSDTPANTGDNLHSDLLVTPPEQFSIIHELTTRCSISLIILSVKSLPYMGRGDSALRTDASYKTLGTEGTPSVEPVDIISLKKMFGLVVICEKIFPVAAREHGLAQNIHTAGMVD